MEIKSFKKKIVTKEPKGVTVTSKNTGWMIKKAKKVLESRDKVVTREPIINLPKRNVTENTVKKQNEDKKRHLPHQFKPGQSGNPNGRPKGALGWRAELLKAGMKEVEFLEKGTGEKIKKTKQQIMAEKMVELCVTGEIRALEEYGNRIDGKAHQSINLDGDLNVTQRLIILPGKKEKN